MSHYSIALAGNKSLQVILIITWLHLNETIKLSEQQIHTVG
jgi:hypothetical protein